MSENTNKLFWISALGIVVTAVAVLIFYSVTKPTKNLYDNTNNVSLCEASSRASSLICLDASNNAQLGGHVNNEGNTKDKWYAQSNLEEEDNGYANLYNFNYDNNSGWLPYALKFDGSNDTIKLNLTNANFDNGMTIQFNVKPLVDNKEMSLISNGNIELKIKDNKFVYNLKTSSGTYSITANKIVSANTWYLITITYNNDRMKIYLNGTLVEEKEISGTILQTSNDFTVGAGLKGEVSSIMIYDKDIEQNGINQNTVAIYEKVYSIDQYRENFNGTDSCEEWTVPMDGEYQLELWGAQGASLGTGEGGKGAYVSGNIKLTKGDKYYLCVGKQGTKTTNLANGGNSTDIRLLYSGDVNSFDSLKSRVMIAAGGGGGYNAIGGAGGTTIGLTSSTSINGIHNPKGGTQSKGGEKATNMTTATDSNTMSYTNGSNGTFGKKSTASSGATGGNGYFSGGAISNQGGAAGGSSYISGHEGVDSITKTSTATAIVNTGSNIHYSGMKLLSTKMITGKAMMPSSSDVNEKTIGQSGDGHLRITYISNGKGGSYGDSSDEGEEVITPTPGKPILKSFISTPTSATATYGAVENALSYACYYGPDKDHLDKLGVVIVTLAGDRQCNVNSLEENHDYAIKMVAINKDKITESDIKEFHTEFKKPGISSPITITTGVHSVNADYTLSENTQSYTCKLGKTSDNLNITGTVSVGSGKVNCQATGLDQDTLYYIQVTSINGDKSSKSFIVNVRTTYAEPSIPEFIETVNKSYASIMNSYKKSDIANAYTCKYGKSSDNLDMTGSITVNSNNLTCSAIGLDQGTDYYFQVTAYNGNLSSSSNITKVKTNYKEPDIPEEIKHVSTNNSITTTFNKVDLGQSYKCYYGSNENDISTEAIVTTTIANENQCLFNGLNQNTKYYYKYVVTNGDKTVTSAIYNAKTLYNQATDSTYINSSITKTSVTTNWKITGNDEYYKCELSSNGSLVSAVASPTISGKTATCAFTNLTADSDYYTRIVSYNGPYTNESEFHKDELSSVLPVLTATYPQGTFNSNNWANKDFNLTIKVESENESSINGLVYCVGTSQCTPTYEITSTEDEFGESTEVIQGTNGSVGVRKPGYNFTYDVKINTNSATNYVCAIGLTKKNKATGVSCWGPYALDKVAPTINFENVTIADTVNTYGMYTGVTITDNLTANDKITKSYSSTPTWGNSGTYKSTYTATDLAGNTSTKERTFTITLTNFNITYNLNGGTISGQKTTYNKKTDAFTLPAPSRTGHTFTGWTGSNGSTAQKTVTINKGSSGDKTYNANWSVNQYTLTINPNGGSWGGTGSNSTATQNYGTTKTVGNPSRTGYTFTGWTQSGTCNLNNTTFTYGAGNCTLTANWSINSYTVDVNPVLDGNQSNTGFGGYTFDVYINGTIVADDVQDWCQGVQYGSTVAVYVNGKTGHNAGNASGTVGAGSLELKPWWSRNTYEAHFYVGSNFWTRTYNKYGDYVSTPAVANVGQFGYDDNFYYFSGFSPWTSWYQQEYAIGFSVNISERWCSATFGSASSSNAAAQLTKAQNAGYGDVCRQTGSNISCEGASSRVLGIYNNAWNIFPSSGSGYSRWKGISCDSGWGNSGTR